MSVKVLKLTNSAFYGLQREIESVKQAVIIVGLEAIKNLVLSASVLDMFKGKDIDQEFQEKFWRHSLAVGFCARLLSRMGRVRGQLDPDSAFSGGLLHDIGKVIMCCFLQAEHAQVKRERANDRQSATYEVEERVLGYNHAQIGAILAEQWKLPRRITEAVAFHHHLQAAEGEEMTPYVTHVANFVSKRTFLERDEQHLVGKLEPGVLDRLQLTEPDLDQLADNLRQEYLKAETFMQMVGIN